MSSTHSDRDNGRKARPCPACLANRSRSKGKKNGFEILTCEDCKSVFTSFVPTMADAQDYDEYYTQEDLSVPAFVIERVRDIVRQFGKYRGSGRLLDIGFGAGSILDVAKEEGWHAVGLEVSKPAVESARSKGHEVFHGTLEDANFPADHFDVITASEILEHLEAPHNDLTIISRILRPGGLFWATTPAATGLSARMLGLDWSVLAPPDHIQLYSRRGVRRILATAGLVPLKIHSYGVNPVEIIRFLRDESSSPDDFNRLEAGYAINQELTRNAVTKGIKQAINYSLDLTGLGDSLKIFATKR